MIPRKDLARKTEDEFQIHAHYGSAYGFEEVTSEHTYQAAKVAIRAYRQNEMGIPFRIVKKRVPKVRAKVVQLFEEWDAAPIIFSAMADNSNAYMCVALADHVFACVPAIVEGFKEGADLRELMISEGEAGFWFLAVMEKDGTLLMTRQHKPIFDMPSALPDEGFCHAQEAPQ
jgi:hypothetical protein